MALITGQIFQGNCTVTKVSDGTIYCHPIPDEERIKSGFIDGWNNFLAQVNGVFGEHIRLSIKWPSTAGDEKTKDLLKSWNITEWYPKKFADFPEYFFYISTDLKEWKKLENISSDGENVIVEFDLPEEVVYITSSLRYTYARYKALFDDFKYSDKVEIIKMSDCSFGDEMFLFKVTDFSVDEAEKKHIYVESAIHCGETTGCFIADYMIRHLVSEAEGVPELLKNYVFHIIPVVDVSGWRLGQQAGTCKNKAKNMNRDFGEFANDETKSIWEYIKNIYDKNPNIITIDFHGGWPSTTDDVMECTSWIGIPNGYPERQLKLLNNAADMLIDRSCSFIPPPEAFSRPNALAISHFDEDPTTMTGYLARHGIPTILIEMSYANAYDDQQGKRVQLSQDLLKRSASRIPHALDKAFKLSE